MRALWLLITLWGCGQDQNGLKELTVEELKKMDRSTVQLVDVRTPEEVSYGIIEGAVVLDFYDPDFNTKIVKLDANQPVVLYCAVGGRSGQAGQWLVESGFGDVYNLVGGIRQWKAAGHKTVKQ